LTDDIEPTDLACLLGSHEEIQTYETSTTHETRDSEITALVAKAVEGDQLAALTAMIEPRQHAEILNIYAQRTASLAVQGRDPNLLRLGLLALAVAYLKTRDFRDNLFTLALLWRSAELLALDPREELERAAARVPPAADFFHGWINRSPDAQALSAMGCREANVGGEFWYETPWRRYRPATQSRETEQRASESFFSRLRRGRRRDPSQDA
jgi:hypothetical protein